MKNTKAIITECRDEINQLLQSPGLGPAQRLQYKIMAKNMTGALCIISWLQKQYQHDKHK